MTRTSIFASGAALLLAGCGTSEEAAPAKGEPLSELNINSAKRQCVNVAVMQQVPHDAAKEACDCTVDTLIDAGQMDSSRTPTNDEQQVALDGCIETVIQSEG